MRILTEARTKANEKLKVQSNSINYLNETDLKKYLDVAGKFLSVETKDIVNWLIVNNDSYIADLSTDDEENAIAGFYNAGTPKQENLKELYNAIDTVVKSGRILEIPTLQTKEQFNDIVSGNKSADCIILDFDSEKGRNFIAKKYEPLIHKLARQWHGKINLPYDDLIGFGYEGLTYAMSTYGKKNKKSNATDSAISQYTFGQYAAYCILNQFRGNGVNASHLVTIPNSVQKKEREEKGHNTKNVSISGDKVVGHNDEGSKTIFDFIGSSGDAGSKLDQQDLDKLWKRVYKALEEEFSEKHINIWYSFYGLNGHKKLKNKELAEKYNVVNSNISYYCYKINSYIMKNKTLLNAFKEIYDLMKECANEIDRETISEGETNKLTNIQEDTDE